MTGTYASRNDIQTGSRAASLRRSRGARRPQRSSVETTCRTSLTVGMPAWAADGNSSDPRSSGRQLRAPDNYVHLAIGRCSDQPVLD